MSMHRIAPVAAIALWAMTISFSLAAPFWPLHSLEPLQRVVTTAAAVATIIWYLQRFGRKLFETILKIGYRMGCQENDRTDRTDGTDRTDHHIR